MAVEITNKSQCGPRAGTLGGPGWAPFQNALVGLLMNTISRSEAYQVQLQLALYRLLKFYLRNI